MSDWDLTFKYVHDQLVSNPLINPEGDPFYLHRHTIVGLRVRVFTPHQRDWVKSQRGIPVLVLKKRK